MKFRHEKVSVVLADRELCERIASYAEIFNLLATARKFNLSRYIVCEVINEYEKEKGEHNFKPITET
jgi:hypothetical protein